MPPRVSVSTTGMAVGVKVGGPVAITAAAQGKQGSAQVIGGAARGGVGAGRAGHGERGGGTHQHAGGEGIRCPGQRTAGRTATWSSSNEALVTVSQVGAITGVAAGGPVTVTATIEGQSGTAQVTVVEAAVASVTVSPPTSIIEAGSTVQLSAVLQDDHGNVLTGRVITWSTSDGVRASVSSTGPGDRSDAGRASHDLCQLGRAERQRAR